ncbi:MAG: FAD-dependent oxidoreductase [Chloroflexi bacterium]|nr:FAD-dependent oxidoreductase [Chloroflexota bacterium]
MSDQTADVVIIGGGAAGCAAAYYLASNGVKATIIEREGVASHASGYNAGGLNPLEGHGWPDPLMPMALQSFALHKELWDALPAETGIDYNGRIMSILKVALDPEDLDDLRATLETFNSAPEPGFSAEWLEREDVLALEPRITPEVIAGIRAVGNGALDGLEFTQALAAGAEKLGATVVAGSAVGFRLGNGKVEAVVTNDGEIACGAVLIAAGPWCRTAEQWLDIAIPVDPLKGQIIRVRPDGPGLDYELIGGGSSMYAKPDGLIWCGATEEEVGFDLSLTDEARNDIMRRATRLMPALSSAEQVLHTACLRPVTPDWLPIVGQAPGWDNVYICAGGQKKGILLGPAMGKGIAEIMASGGTEISLQGCDPGRFAGSR